MALIVKTEKIRNPQFIVADILIFSTECIKNFIEKHVKRIYSYSKAITENTCIVDINRLDANDKVIFDEDKIPISIPNDKDIITCLFNASLANPVKISGTINKYKHDLPVDHITYSSLKGREFQKNDKLKILEPADNILFDFKFVVAITEISFGTNLNSILTELKNFGVLLNRQEIEILKQNTADIFTIIATNNTMVNELKEDIKNLEEDIIKLNDDKTKLKEYLNDILKQINSLRIYKQADQKLLEEKEEVAALIDIDANEIQAKKYSLAQKKNELELTTSWLKQSLRNRIFVVEHITPMKENWGRLL